MNNGAAKSPPPPHLLQSIQDMRDAYKEEIGEGVVALLPTHHALRHHHNHVVTLHTTQVVQWTGDCLLNLVFDQSEILQRTFTMRAVSSL